MAFRVKEDNRHSREDVRLFLDELRGVGTGFFDRRRDVIVTRAPGRLDVMGGIADYSGSLVMQLPIAEATFAAIQPSADEVIRVVSYERERGIEHTWEISLDHFRRQAGSDYRDIASTFAGRDHWASYAAGPLYVLAKEQGVTLDSGINIRITSDVPIGKGVSSSAAIEVAVMQAVCVCLGVSLGPRGVALLCQRVENLVVGAACGVMDQMTSACGREGHLLALVCQPAELLEPVPVPDEIEFCGIDSGVRHAVVGADYSSVRAATFMGYRILADAAKLPAVLAGEGQVDIEDEKWTGYLANVGVNEYERDFRGVLPDSIMGEEFLRLYGGSTDAVTSIDPLRHYQVLSAAEHAIYESDRVRRFAQLLASSLDDATLNTLGELMFASHASYAACGLNEPKTDRLVEMVRERRGDGLYGARITGGGSGGTVAVLARRGSSAAIHSLAAAFAAETGYEPKLFAGSSPGCADFGFLRVRLD